jgi:hypothetical protein
MDPQLETVLREIVLGIEKQSKMTDHHKIEDKTGNTVGPFSIG